MSVVSGKPAFFSKAVCHSSALVAVLLSITMLAAVFELAKYAGK